MSAQGKQLKTHAKLRGNLQSWMIMLPGLILMTFFVWEPLLESIRMSLYKTRNVELVRFIGFDNFVSVTGKSLKLADICLHIDRLAKEFYLLNSVYYSTSCCPYRLIANKQYGALRSPEIVL